jgi:hypothetical protein
LGQPDKAIPDSAEEKMREDKCLEVSGEIPFDPKRLTLGCFKPLYTMGRARERCPLSVGRTSKTALGGLFFPAPQLPLKS